MQYEKDLRKLTVSQGKCDEAHRQGNRQHLLRAGERAEGGFSATFWQGIARLFGSNLKVKFDPEGEDKVLNELIGLYERGQL
jgi:hypothetical protein